MMESFHDTMKYNEERGGIQKEDNKRKTRLTRKRREKREKRGLVILRMESRHKWSGRQVQDKTRPIKRSNDPLEGNCARDF
jgi:hypothetical protein